MNLKKVKYLIYALGAALVVTIMAGYLLRSMALVVVALGLCAAIVAVNLAMWRCPHCGAHLGRDVSKFCTHCGKKLEDLE